MTPHRKSRLQKIIALISSPRISLSKSRGLFVISHMRSRAPALSHVLGSHPQIVGHGELLRGCRSWIDMALSRIELQQPSSSLYFHYKLLHNYTFLANSLLTAPPKKTKYCFCFANPSRQPRAAFAFTDRKKPIANELTMRYTRILPNTTVGECLTWS